MYISLQFVLLAGAELTVSRDKLPAEWRIHMWTRAELKSKAKQTLSRSYWKCVLVSLILAVATGALQIGSVSVAISWISGAVVSSLQSLPLDGTYFASFALAIMTVIAVLTMVFRLIGTIIKIFLLSPLEVGGRSFYVSNRAENAGLKTLGKGFSVDYLNVVKTMFLRMLFTALWTILFIIPGIIKSYEYRMIPYILAENPRMDSREAFRLSKEMMNGQKWKTFVLDLSFLGWEILSCFTLGILSVFYVSPYKDNTDVELYSTLKDKTFGGAQSAQGQDTVWEDEQGSWENARTADVDTDVPVYSETAETDFCDREEGSFSGFGGATENDENN